MEIESKSGRLKVGIQGYAGAFHEVAARFCFENEEMEIIPAHTFEELVTEIEKGEKMNAGLMAIENTLAGSLMRNYDLLNQSKLKIVAEVYLRIKQNLLVLPGTRMEDLKEVHSHPMAIAQSREFFSKHPHIRLIETIDTALSAREVRENSSKHTGAIASTLASELYNLDILQPSIETNKKNYTRFLVLQKNNGMKIKEEADKISLSFSLDHEVGSLYKVLAVMAAYDVNLTKIQSAPIVGSPWEYRFFIDFIKGKRVGYKQALEAIKPLTHNLKVLGVYRKGKHFEH